MIAGTAETDRLEGNHELYSVQAREKRERGKRHWAAWRNGEKETLLGRCYILVVPSCMILVLVLYQNLTYYYCTFHLQ
ncbi:hypothetical protein BDW59DRAFT_98296 [Aspergillus cavernicola]|uniref:Uncharacterized protein n=1 Tax=Aspergillus cavernicola TaxID=176166 RepID=A0ABR4I6R0_9EURO